MQLTLGPVFYNWPPNDWRDFYFRIADEAPVDNVVLGEVVCSKRAPFFAPHIAEVAERFSAAGKQVLLASLALVTTARERRLVEELASPAEDAFMVEANDVSCLAHLNGRPHAIGPFINVYHEAAAMFFVKGGARRLCLPPELPAESIERIARAVPDAVIEVFAFGRVPLAISARCYHARLHKLSKDNCRFVCENDPDGLAVDTLDGERFLSLNGVQTLSHACANLITDAAWLCSIGAGALRLSPQRCDMVAVAQVFREVLDGSLEAGAADFRLAGIYSGAAFSNGFLRGANGAAQV